MMATCALDIGIGVIEDVVPLSDPKWASLWAILEEFAWFAFGFFFWSVARSELWVDMKVPRLRLRNGIPSIVWWCKGEFLADDELVE